MSFSNKIYSIAYLNTLGILFTFSLRDSKHNKTARFEFLPCPQAQDKHRYHTKQCLLI